MSIISICAQLYIFQYRDFSDDLLRLPEDKYTEENNNFCSMLGNIFPVTEWHIFYFHSVIW